MAVCRVEIREGQTTFYVEVPGPGGVATESQFLVVHQHVQPQCLPTINERECEILRTCQRCEGLLNPDAPELALVQEYEVPGVGTIVFLNTPSDDGQSHKTDGPYLLVEGSA